MSALPEPREALRKTRRSSLANDRRRSRASGTSHFDRGKGVRNDFIAWLRALRAAGVQAHGDVAGFKVALAEDEHGVDARVLGVGDLHLDRFVGEVAGHADEVLAQLVDERLAGGQEQGVAGQCGERAVRLQTVAMGATRKRKLELTERDQSRQINETKEVLGEEPHQARGGTTK